MTILSPGNIKLGKMPNVSLPPIVSCNGCGDHCGSKCYSMKAYRMYPAVREKWDNNLKLATTYLNGYFSQIFAELLRKKKLPKFFRWHTSGDILNSEYLKGMVAIATALPSTKFLCFTKQYSIVNAAVEEKVDLPENLQIIFSAWPGLSMSNPHNFRVAWMQDGTETRVPASAFECPGSCETCSACFSLSKIGKDVVFELH